MLTTLCTWAWLAHHRPCDWDGKASLLCYVIGNVVKASPAHERSIQKHQSAMRWGHPLGGCWPWGLLQQGIRSYHNDIAEIIPGSHWKREVGSAEAEGVPLLYVPRWPEWSKNPLAGEGACFLQVSLWPADEGAFRVEGGGSTSSPERP